MELTPDLILRAYSVGIFPMAENRFDPYIHWIDPEIRGILPLDKLHIPRKLKRKMLRAGFDVRCDTAFSNVVKKCAEKTPSRPETWINPTIEKLYVELHKLGFAHSVETWEKKDDTGEMRLVGGLYGVALGSAFFGESMFSRVSDASKIALAHLFLHLRAGKFTILDTQFTTPHLRQFGAVDVPREEYKSMLANALRQISVFPPTLSIDQKLEILKDITASH